MGALIILQVGLTDHFTEPEKAEPIAHILPCRPIIRCINWPDRLRTIIQVRYQYGDTTTDGFMRFENAHCSQSESRSELWARTTITAAWRSRRRPTAAATWAPAPAGWCARGTPGTRGCRPTCAWPGPPAGLRNGGVQSRVGGEGRETVLGLLHAQAAPATKQPPEIKQPPGPPAAGCR